MGRSEGKGKERLPAITCRGQESEVVDTFCLWMMHLKVGLTDCSSSGSFMSKCKVVGM